MITLTSFKWVPPIAQGLSRDLRVRWALEETGLQYENKQIEGQDQSSASYRKCQPFGEIPVYQEDELVLFESGAIVLHIANKDGSMLPADDAERARTITWLFAALNSVEPIIERLAEIDLGHPNEEWAKLRRPSAVAAVKQRLSDLSAALGENDYLERSFSVADLMMATVLRILRHTDLVAGEPRLKDYLDRCTKRPAFERAERDHLEAFAKS